MRLPARFLLTGAAVLVVSSCATDRPVAPPLVSGNPVLRALVIAQTVDFVIPTSGTTVNLLDAFTLHIPAGAVCDPNAADTQQGYAAASWDAPCTPATGDIAVRATLKYTNGKLYADFQPALRFVPSKNVTLSTRVLAAEVQQLDDAGVKDGWSIQYSPGIDASGIADAQADASLRTVVVGSTGRIFRRIKHFSGYMITSGMGELIPCDPADGNPECVWVEDDPTDKG
jgi:hypothetical protein